MFAFSAEILFFSRSLGRYSSRRRHYISKNKHNENKQLDKIDIIKNNIINNPKNNTEENGYENHNLSYSNNIYHEKQELELCGKHAINNLLQKEAITKDQMDKIALNLIEKENEISEIKSNEESNNHYNKNTGNYSVEVLIETLAINNLKTEFMKYDIKFKTEIGFLINNDHHWWTIIKKDNNFIEIDSCKNNYKIISEQKITKVLLAYKNTNATIITITGKNNNKSSNRKRSKNNEIINNIKQKVVKETINIKNEKIIIKQNK